MEALQEKFIRTPRYKQISLIAGFIGVVCLVVGFFVYGMGDKNQSAIFWAGLMHNSMFALLVVISSMLILCMASLAMGGWITVIRRVPEAIAAVVPVLGVLTFVILLGVIFTSQTDIYQWLSAAEALHPPLHTKAIFLNPTNFVIWSGLAILVWSCLGYKIRKHSYILDTQPIETVEQRKKYIFNSTILAALFLVFFGLTVGSSLIWMWLMSITEMWYSTLYSWYVLISSLTAGFALIAIYVIYLKKQNTLKLATHEHIHDLGKFIFGFSFLWAYFWYSQYMLIWYADIPEETIYFRHRLEGVYGILFYLNFIINFIFPFFMLMTRDSKRKYTILTIVSFIIILGHWLDFYILIFPSIAPVNMGNRFAWYDLGLLVGFIGLLMYCIGKALERHNLVPANHPFFKESVILKS
ncbi:MAG: quinol:cytochrome C oxidoreductase [Chitinophagaceae bacterium]